MDRLLSDDIDELKKKRSQFMQKLYQVTGGDENKYGYFIFLNDYE